MMDLNRRSALALGVSLGAVPVLALVNPAAAATYGPDEGKRSHPVSEL